MYSSFKLRLCTRYFLVTHLQLGFIEPIRNKDLCNKFGVVQMFVALIYLRHILFPIQDLTFEYENYLNYKKRDPESVLYLEHFSSIKN
jgi:hypothetical protein